MVRKSRRIKKWIVERVTLLEGANLSTTMWQVDSSTQLFSIEEKKNMV